MIEREVFIRGTNFIKNKHKVTSEEMAASIGEKRHAIDNPRRGSSKVRYEIVEKLITRYPDSEEYFASNDAQDTVNDSMIMVSDGRAWKELAETQRKLIENLEHRLVKETEDRRELEAEVKYLRAKVIELEKLKK